MTRPGPTFLLAALAVLACAGPKPLAGDAAARLARGGPIPVVHVRADPPWVDCPNEEGQKVWQMPGSASREPAWGVRLASAAPGVPVVRVGDTWETIQDQWTEKRQSPPVDPAATTAGH
ncbi:MAG TPA: hypothetical protein PLL32_05160, partial [Anaeromyxobacteraceae bacterium]|nr:hypothetical protein [Anaeromyxobacteraceae bacterium]